MRYSTIDELYSYYKKAAKVTSVPGDVEPGDLYIAFQRNRPLNKFLQHIWDAIESTVPSALKLVLWVVVKFRLSIKISQYNRAEGNRYALKALENGAIAAVVDVRRYCRGENVLLVKDTREALMELAKLHRSTLHIPIVAITGSNGKSTTKELVKNVLNTHLSTVATPGSANSVAAISRAVLSIREKTDIAVMEMGIMARGELAELCSVVQPTCGLITSIGLTHLNHLKNIDGVAKAKGELFAHLKKNGGHIFLNLDDERISSLANNYEKVTTYGNHKTAQIRGEVIASDPLITVRCFIPEEIESAPKSYVDVRTHFVGSHYLNQVLVAVTVGCHFHVPLNKIVSAIEEFQPLENRAQLLRVGTNTIILDAYNANPSSMSAALVSLQAIQQQPKIAILGEMLDLGNQSRSAHEGILQQVKAIEGITAVLIGKQFSRIKENGFGLYFRNTDDARRWYQEQQFRNCCILIKGSRTMKMEWILE